MKHLLAILLIAGGCLLQHKSLAQDVTIDTMQQGTAVEEGSSDTHGEPATHTYRRRYMDKERMQSLRSKKEFQYPDLENDTLETKPKEEVTSSSGSGFQGFDASILLWMVLAIAAVVLVLQLAGLNMRQLFSPGAARGRQEEIQMGENIHDIPYDTAIQQAIREKNYRLAVRLMYLQSLKLLSDRQLIEWNENKTNWQYVYELKDGNLRHAFRDITSVFEYVHYGQMQVPEEKFTVIQQVFHLFKTAVR